MAHTILITGATGFVGSHILEALMKIEHSDLEIIVACRDKRQLLPHYKGEIRVGDLRDPVYLDHVLAGVDIICHGAGWNSLWSHNKESKKLYLKPTLNLIDKAIEWKVKRLVNPSSVFVGNHTANPHDPGKPVSFWPQLNHMITIENMMRDQCHLGCAMVNLRLGVFAGKRHSLSLLPVFANKFKTGTLPFRTSDSAPLPIIDGRDIGQAFVRAALAPQEIAYESYNIVGTESPRLSTVIEYLEQQFEGKKPKLILPWQFAHLVALFNEVLEQLTHKEPAVTRSIIHMLRGSTANNDRATELLGFQPEIHWKQSLQNLMEDVVNTAGQRARLVRTTRKLDL